MYHVYPRSKCDGSRCTNFTRATEPGNRDVVTPRGLAEFLILLVGHIFRPERERPARVERLVNHARIQKRVSVLAGRRRRIELGIGARAIVRIGVQRQPVTRSEIEPISHTALKHELGRRGKP